MGDRKKYSSFESMPKPLQDFLLSEEFSDTDIALTKTFNINEVTMEKVSDIVISTILGEISLQNAIAQIKATLIPAILTEEKWIIFLSELIRLQIWPVREVFGVELTQVLTSESIRTAGWPLERILLRPLTYSGAATEIASRVGFTFIGPHMRERMRDLVISKLKGVRIDTQIKEVLMRPADFGGIGLDEITASRTVEVLNIVISSVRIMSEDEYTNHLAEEAHAEEKKEIVPIQSTEGMTSFTDVKPKELSALLVNAIDSIWNSIPQKPEDEYLQSRLRNVISSRLRDVRSAHELALLLERDTKVGGLGLSSENAQIVSKAIEAGYATYRDPILQEEKKNIEMQMEVQKKKIEERRKKEAEDHAKWYQEKIASKKSMESTFKNPMEKKEEKKEKERFGELMSTVARPEIKVSQPTLVASSNPFKPRIEDVRQAPRLFGLEQELHDLSLAEFRRLGKNPAEAVDKILQKVEILSQESIEKRIAGIQAYHTSPLQKSYLTLVTDSFKLGRPVSALAEEKRSKGVDVPSPDELSAIISLNSRLHY